MDSFSEVAAVIAFIGLCAGGIGYIVRKFVSGSDEADDRVIESQNKEIQSLGRRLEMVEREGREKDQKISHLEGRLSHIDTENRTLRQLIMGERVPQALADAIEQISERTIEAVEKMLAGHLESAAKMQTEHLATYASLLATFEDEYLEPLKGAIEPKPKGATE